VECVEPLVTGWRDGLGAAGGLPTPLPPPPVANANANAKAGTGKKRKKASGPPPPSSLDERMLYIATFLHPIRKLTYESKNKTLPVTSYVVRESLKFKNKDVQDITTIMTHVDALQDVLTHSYIQTPPPSNSPLPPTPFCRLTVGLLLRNLKDLWVTTLLVAAVAAIQSTNKTPPSSPATAPPPATVLRAMLQFHRDVHAQNLDGCWRERPLLDGRALIQSLDLPNGPVVGRYMQEQVQWMLRNPDGGEGGGAGRREECEAYLKGLRERELVEGGGE